MTLTTNFENPNQGLRIIKKKIRGQRFDFQNLK